VIGVQDKEWLCTVMCPQGLVFVLKAKELCPCPHLYPRTQVLGLEIKSSAMIPRTLINFVHYQFITDKLKKNVEH